MRQDRTDRSIKNAASAAPSVRGRRYIRRGNVLRYGVTPKTRSSLSEGGTGSLKRAIPVAAMRALFVFCGLLFLGTGLYSMLF